MDMSWSCLLDRLYTTLHGFTGSLAVAAHMSKVKMDSEVEPIVQPKIYPGMSRWIDFQLYPFAAARNELSCGDLVPASLKPCQLCRCGGDDLIRLE